MPSFSKSVEQFSSMLCRLDAFELPISGRVDGMKAFQMALPLRVPVPLWLSSAMPRSATFYALDHL